MTRSKPSNVLKLTLSTATALSLSLALILFLSSASATYFAPESEPVAAEYLVPPGADAWSMGRVAYDAGEFERAVAYWKQVPESDPQYARSLRYIGWEVYAEELGEPARALPFVHRCLWVAPLDGNTWQDLGRTYAVLLGFDV